MVLEDISGRKNAIPGVLVVAVGGGGGRGWGWRLSRIRDVGLPHSPPPQRPSNLGRGNLVQ